MITQEPQPADSPPIVCSAITLVKFQKPGCFRAYHPIYQVGSSRLLLYSFLKATDSSQPLGNLKVGLLCVVVIFITALLSPHQVSYTRYSSSNGVIVVPGEAPLPTSCITSTSNRGPNQGLTVIHCQGRGRFLQGSLFPLVEYQP